MTEEIKDGTSAVAVEEGQEVTSTVNEGVQVTQPKNEELQPFKTYATQTDYDNEAARIKRATERDLFKKAGVKDFSELEKMREIYEANLTEAQKMAQKLEDAEKIREQNQYKDYMITALATKANITLEEVGVQVAMAKGLLAEGICTDFKEAFDIAIGTHNKVEKPPVPQGKNIMQPDVPTAPVNPFKKGANFSLKEQSELFKKDPVLARQLAKEAGITL